MCGIIGAIGLEDHFDIDRDQFRKLIDSMEHRGPDSWGVFHHDRFSFGHRRLKIIDLSDAAQQPMLDLDRQVVITFNGEIYNFQDIRNELSNKGHIFRSHSDTEVIIEAYKAWGISCVHRLNGDFAFGLYDLRTNEFHLVRDRLGVKPVYYARINETFVFSSELKGIISYPGFRKSLNLKAVSSFLSFRYCLGEETYFNGVSQLLPGHYVSVKNQTQRMTKYWDVDLTLDTHSFNERDKTELKSLIHDAVAKRTISDVPLGAYLSGGLDSTIILNEMSKLDNESTTTFTVAFNESGFDETKYANLASKRYSSKNKTITIDGDQYLQHVQELIRIKDQPLGMHNEVALYLLAQKVKEEVTVILSGEGADEIFSGYGRLFRSPFDYNRLRLIHKLPSPLRGALVSATGLNGNLMNLDKLGFFLQLYPYFPFEEKFSLFNQDVTTAVARDEHIIELFRKRFAAAECRSFYDQISYTFVKMHLPGLLLMMDATSMASAVEVRVPFVDHRVVEKSFRLPTHMKLKWRSLLSFAHALFQPAAKFSETLDSTKHALRELYANELPREILERRKMVFPVPLTNWFSGEFNALSRRELLDGKSRIGRVFDPARLKAWMNVKEATRDDPIYGRKIWLMLNLEYWLREYFG